MSSSLGNNQSSAAREKEATVNKTDADRGDKPIWRNGTPPEVTLKYALNKLHPEEFPTFAKQYNSTLTFPEKLMLLLVHVERISAKSGKKPFCESIEWTNGGKSFVIRSQKDFTEKWLPKFFSHAKFSSFTRKLYRWGFRKVTTNPEKGSSQTEPYIVFTGVHFQRSKPEELARMCSVTAAKVRSQQAARRTDELAMSSGSGTTETTLTNGIQDRSPSLPLSSISTAESQLQALQNSLVPRQAAPPFVGLENVSSAAALVASLAQLGAYQQQLAPTTTPSSSPANPQNLTEVAIMRALLAQSRAQQQPAPSQPIDSSAHSNRSLTDSSLIGALLSRSQAQHPALPSVLSLQVPQLQAPPAGFSRQGEETTTGNASSGISASQVLLSQLASALQPQPASFASLGQSSSQQSQGATTAEQQQLAALVAILLRR